MEDIHVDGWVTKGACGNVMHALTSVRRKAGNGGNNRWRCPKHAHTVFLPALDSNKTLNA